MLMGGGKTGVGGSNFEHMRTDAGLAELAKLVNGIGPSISSIVSGNKVTDLTSRAHAHGVEVHPYTLRIDDLPKGIATPEELMHLLLMRRRSMPFTDFPDVTVNWLMKATKH